MTMLACCRTLRRRTRLLLAAAVLLPAVTIAVIYTQRAVRLRNLCRKAQIEWTTHHGSKVPDFIRPLIECPESVQVTRGRLSESELDWVFSRDTITMLDLGPDTYSCSELQGLSRLKDLDMLRVNCGECVRDGAGIPALPTHLWGLAIYRSGVDAAVVRSLRRCDRLAMLVFLECDIQVDALAALDELHSVEIVECDGGVIDGCPAVGFAWSEQLINLRFDDVRMDGCLQATLATARNVGVLSLRQTGVDDTVFSLLPPGSRLRVLDVSETSVTEAGVEGYRRAHPECDVRW